jgi:fructosamine-3-kinase
MLARLRSPGSELRDAVLRAMDAMPRLFDDGYAPSASLIHGDLWSGNWGRLQDGTPVIFDPCVSFSDREAELAMMELFGAPPAGFWRAYASAAGLAPGYGKRRPLYQLYHLLNHAVLFGGACEQQAMACARACVAAAPG